VTAAPRRITVVYPVYRAGGNEQFILHLARGLPDFGWQVCAVNTGLPDGPLKPAYEKFHVPVVNCWLRTTDSYLSFLRRLRGAVRSFEPDVLLTIDRDWGLQLAGQLPSVACVHKISNEDVCGYTAFLKDGYRDFDAIVGISQKIRTQLKSLLPPSAHDLVRVIIYGTPDAISPTATRPYSLPGQPLRLIWVGRLDIGQKRIQDLPPVAAGLRAAGVAFTWEVVGDGPARGLLESSLRTRRLTDFVNLVGFKNEIEVQECLRNSDMLVNFSAYEGGPWTVLEALAAGAVPVISAIPSDICDLVRDGETGRRVPVGDSEAFVRAIIALDRDREQLARLGAAGRAIIHKGYTLERMCAEYNALFRELLERQDARTRCVAERPLGFPSWDRRVAPWLPMWIRRPVLRFAPWVGRV
jgi:glycosyltransferase involved in cell wall biosynthesis